MTSYNYSLSDMISTTTKETTGIDFYSLMCDYAYQIGAIGGMAVYSYYLNRNYMKTLYQIATPASIFLIEDYFSDTMKDNLMTVSLSSLSGLYLGNRFIIPYDANMLLSGIAWRTGLGLVGSMTTSKFFNRLP